MIYQEDALSMPLQDLLPIMQEKITRHSTYFGIPTMKNPTDVWIYQEILTELKPDVILEIGTWYGGSALMFAHLCDNLNWGQVISVDKDHSGVYLAARVHPRISLMEGDASSVVDRIKARFSDAKMLVIEDSSHEYDQCLDVLRKYSQLVSIGSYLIVEDTICNHGLPMNPVPGPQEAVETFLSENKNFESDRSREPYLVTWNPKGYLKRIK
jgi:cephalosporin hydroxylase